MRKVLSIFLCLAMVLSLSVTAFATDYPSGTGAQTNVTYTPEIVETYSVTVPASLTPVSGSNSGTVSVSGKWASNRVVKVDADATVTLENSINSLDIKTLDITFPEISKVGSNTVAITGEELDAHSTVSVAPISNALFGTWEGTFNYTVGIEDVVPKLTEPGAVFSKNDDYVVLSWDELKDSANGDLYGYRVDKISDTSIGLCAFEDCVGLTSIELPNSVESIGENAFYGCIGLTSIVLPDGVTSIGRSAFTNCSGLTSIVLPNSVTYIDYYAFIGCSGLTSIEIPDKVTSIGGNPFRGCVGLTSITVAEGNTVYDSRNNCNAIIHTGTNTLIAGCKNTVIPDGVERISEEAFYHCIGLTSIVIPASVERIGGSAFSGCSDLTSIALPDGVTHIGAGAFGSCSGLTSVIYKGTTYTSISELKSALTGASVWLGNDVFYASGLSD